MCPTVGRISAPRLTAILSGAGRFFAFFHQSDTLFPVMLMLWKPLKILSFGAGTPSTALALMSCENKLAGRQVHPLVPVYDYILFCDLKAEPGWVYRQLAFVQEVCRGAGIPLIVLESDLYGLFVQNFGRSRVPSIPFWTLGPDGRQGKMPRQCTCDCKIKVMERFVRYDLLDYRPRQRARSCDQHAHEMHMGIMKEERRRARPSTQTLFQNRYPLVEMGWTRADCFAYNRERWGLDTWASACVFCPFHTHAFYPYLQEHDGPSYDKARRVDTLLEQYEAVPPLTSRPYLTKCHKRLRELAAEDCGDMRTFLYQGREVWNGF